MNWQGADKNIAKPFVSVIIPVFNDAHRLQICLEALGNQTYPENLYEVIVVDNGSDEAVEKIVGHFAQASVIVENRPGSYAARNKGIALAGGEIIAFTDADCIPGTDWIKKGVFNILRHPNCGLVGGKIEVFFKNPQRLTSVELYESLRAFPQKKYIEKLHFGATANMFTLKRVFDTVGLFNDKLTSGGDREWGQRVFYFGYKHVYAENACVAHPARFSFRQLHQKIARINSSGNHDLPAEGSQFHFNRVGCLMRFLIPPLKTIISKAFLEPRLPSTKDKLKLAFVLLYRHYVISAYRIHACFWMVHQKT